MSDSTSGKTSDSKATTSKAGSSSAKASSTKNTTSNQSTAVSERNSEVTSDKNKVTENEQEEIIAEENESEQGKETDIAEEKPIDLGGRTIRLYSPFVVEDLREGISPFWDSVYSSFKAVEKKYNCKIESVYVNSTTMTNEFVNSILAGTVLCEAYDVRTSTIFPSFVSRGLIIPVDDYIDFENDPVWNPINISTSVLWRGKHWAIPGPIPSGGEVGIVVFYNKDIFARYGIQDLYEMFKNDTWTWEKFVEVSQQLTSDLNGDGIIDQYAVTSIIKQLCPPIVASNGGRFIRTTGEDNKLISSISEYPAMRALQFSMDLIYTYKVVNPDGLTKSNTTNSVEKFTKGQDAMLIDGAYQIKYLQTRYGMASEPGMVLFPKGPDATEYKNVMYASRGYVVPVILKDPEILVPIMAEALSSWDPSKEYWVNGGTSGNVINNIVGSGDVFSPQNVELYEVFGPQVEYIHTDGINNYWTTFTNAMRKVYEGKSSLGSSLESIMAPLQSILDETCNN